MSTIPPEIICEIIDQAPFDVFCAFAKTSKGNLAHCKKMLPIRAKQWLIVVNSDDEQGTVLPNGVLHDYYYYSTTSCRYINYALYYYGKPLIKIRQYKGSLFDTYVDLFSNGEKTAEYKYIRTGGMNKLNSFILTNIGSFIVDFESGLGFLPEIFKRENVLNIYERISKENIYDKIVERISNMDYFAYNTNGFSIDVKIKDRKLIIAKPLPMTYEIYHVRPEIVTTIKSLVLPEIFTIIKHWLCPEFEPPEIGQN